MKKELLFLVLAAISTIGEARSTSVRGYVKRDGSFVMPHMRTTPNSTRFDNWSTQGNFNPYTGKEGTKPLVKPISDSAAPFGR